MRARGPLPQPAPHSFVIWRQASPSPTHTHTHTHTPAHAPASQPPPRAPQPLLAAAPALLHSAQAARCVRAVCRLRKPPLPGGLGGRAARPPPVSVCVWEGGGDFLDQTRPDQIRPERPHKRALQQFCCPSTHLYARARTHTHTHTHTHTCVRSCSAPVLAVSSPSNASAAATCDLCMHHL